MALDNALYSRRVAKILPSRDGLAKLSQSRKLRVYLGVDPTGARLHLGHAIGLRKLGEFAAAGHEAIFLFGTGTVLVGDPSQRESARTEVSAIEIENNIKAWREMAAKVVDIDKIKIMQNGDWITKMSLKELIAIASKISAVQLFKRESFQRRLESGDTVWYHETMYPLLQGYDSVKLDVDLEIGGSDQEFNMLMGRELQKKINQKEKYVLTTPMIMGTDGQQMSKTSDNCIWLDDSATDMYGKVMSLNDELMDSYFELCTVLSEAEIKEVKSSTKNPRDLKARLALEITKLYHGEAEAGAAAEAFDSQFTGDKIPSYMPSADIAIHQQDGTVILVEIKLASSKTEARRLIEQGGVKINSQPVTVVNGWKLKSGDVIQVGKRRFVRIK